MVGQHNALAPYIARLNDSGIRVSLFIAADPQLGALNLMLLGSPESAILSAIIFNALIIIALIPLALRGVRYRPVGASTVLRDAGYEIHYMNIANGCCGSNEYSAEHTARIRLHYLEGMDKNDAPALVCCSARMESSSASIAKSRCRRARRPRASRPAMTIPCSTPPLAKSARIQGTVHFNAVISKDGTIQNLTLVSGATWKQAWPNFLRPKWRIVSPTPPCNCTAVMALPATFPLNALPAIAGFSASTKVARKFSA